MREHIVVFFFEKKNDEWFNDDDHDDHHDDHGSHGLCLLMNDCNARHSSYDLGIEKKRSSSIQSIVELFFLFVWIIH